MASEMLKQILDAENNCNSEIEKAQNKAYEIIKNAEKECDEITASVIENARAEAAALVEAAQNAAAQSEADAQRECSETAKKTEENAKAKFDEAVNCVIESII
ncbi:MAG: hypothetical protein IJK60_06235 [Clostridia bacterium]|nr:hypothetical protein [Clostridia bacterium]